MTAIATIAVLVVAMLHAYFLYLEMVLWDTPKGHRTFGLTPEFAAASKVLAANQGLYNGFLAAGLVWGVASGPASAPGGYAIEVFFLVCVIVAGVYGGLTSSRRILFIQALPAAIALGLVVLSNRP